MGGGGGGTWRQGGGDEGGSGERRRRRGGKGCCGDGGGGEGCRGRAAMVAAGRWHLKAASALVCIMACRLVPHQFPHTSPSRFCSAPLPPPSPRYTPSQPLLYLLLEGERDAHPQLYTCAHHTTTLCSLLFLHVAPSPPPPPPPPSPLAAASAATVGLLTSVGEWRDRVRGWEGGGGGVEGRREGKGEINRYNKGGG